MVLAAIVGYLVYTIVKLRDSDYSVLANRMATRSRKSFEVLKPCPICNTMLRRGERLHTVVYTAGGRAQSRRAQGDAGSRAADSRAAGSRAPDSRDEDTLTHIFGCPYCYPPDDEHPRYCPVCERKLRPDDYVIARMFNRAPRSHVHVLGCTQCRGPGSRARR
ncbi:MAG: hypothetical protein ACLFPO_04515 [Spirochaetaceae bacterium]